MGGVAENILKLKDIHLPESPGYWPLAPGWWILLVLILLVGILLIRLLLRQARQRKYKQKILDQYIALENKLLEKPDNQAITDINIFMRQLAISKYPRTDIASLTGSKWLQFLDQSGKTQKFTQGMGQVLIAAPYQSGELNGFSSAEFTPLIRQWIKAISKKSNKSINHKTYKKRGGGYE